MYVSIAITVLQVKGLSNIGFHEYSILDIDRYVYKHL